MDFSLTDYEHITSVYFHTLTMFMHARERSFRYPSASDHEMPGAEPLRTGKQLPDAG
jgi:hypothetical protein